MIAELNQNDIDNLKLAIDKLKMAGGFDAATKMALLVEAYEAQNGGDSEAAQLREAIEDLPGWSNRSDHQGHLGDTVDMLGRAHDTIQEWEDSKDDEPLDEAVKRLVSALDVAAEKHAKHLGALEAALADIAAEAALGARGSLSRIRELAVDALP